MVVEESVIIQAPLDKVWGLFTDFSCWQEWSATMTDVSVVEGAEGEDGAGGEGGKGPVALHEGKRFSFCIRPFSFPTNVEPMIEELIPKKRVVWSGTKYGIFSRHEFIFDKTKKGVKVTSRETFGGPAMAAWRLVFPEETFREITRRILNELREASEA